MWVVLIILVIGVIWLVKKKPPEEVGQQEAVPVTQHSAARSFSDHPEEDEEFIAVLTAAIAEFTHLSAEEFKVLAIRQQNENWVLTARQGIMYNRL